MSSLVAIGLAALGASMVTDTDTVTYWVVGAVVLPEAGCDSMGEAWVDHEDGGHITRPFGGCFEGPPGLQLEDERVHAEVLKLLHTGVEENHLGPDEIQTRWINEVIGRRSWYDRPAVGFSAIEGGVMLYLDAGEKSEVRADPYYWHLGEVEALPEPPVSKKDAMRQMLSQMPYHFVLFVDGLHSSRRDVRASSYTDAASQIGEELGVSPVLLAVRGGRMLVPEDQRP